MSLKTAVKEYAKRTLCSILDISEPSKDRSNRWYHDRGSVQSEDRLTTQYDRDAAIARCHDLVRNSAIARGIVDRVRDMTVGTGITPQAQTDDEAWNNQAEAFWRSWSKAPETSGLSDMTDVLKLSASSLITDGGVGILKHSNGSIQLVELSRFRPHPDEPISSLPYKTDTNGKITHWCIWDRDETGGFTNKDLASWVSVKHVLVLFDRRRPDQVMPYPQLAPAANMLQDVNEINQFTLRQAKVQSAVAVVHQKGATGKPLHGGGRNSKAGEGGDEKIKKNVESVGWSLIDTDGQVSMLTPSTPSSTYDSFIKLNIQFVGMCVSLPFEFLMLFFGEGTYSSSKATLMQAREAIHGRQQGLIRFILRPLWIWRISKAVADGLLPPPPDGLFDYTKVYFQLPSFEWVDQKDSVQTEMQQVLAGFRSRREIAAKYGYDFDTLLRENARDLKKISEVEKEFGLPPGSLSKIQLSGSPEPAKKEVDSAKA